MKRTSGLVSLFIGLLAAAFLLVPFATTVYPESTVIVPFEQVQFIATHNSYRLDDPPHVLIDQYNVWEIELDFGIAFDSPDFLVGHDGPESKHSLHSLGDWVRDMLSAESAADHPTILKLEAKTTKPCSQFRFPSFQCTDNWDNKWQQRLRDTLQSLIGKDNWITRARFENDYDTEWPTVDCLAGKVIVTLQDNNQEHDIDTTTQYFFVRDVPQLRAAWPPVETKTEFQQALEAGINRLTTDDAYRAPWATSLPMIRNQ